MFAAALAAPGAVSLVYRRLMARQVPQWDLLLAQNEEARRNLCSAMGYTGDVLVGEYPRNAGLLGGTRVRYRVRAELDSLGATSTRITATSDLDEHPTQPTPQEVSA